VNCTDADGLEKVIIVVGPTKGSGEAAAQEYIVGVIIEKLLSLGYTRNDILILTSPDKKTLVGAAKDAETLVFVGHGSYEGEFNYTGSAYFEGTDRDSLRRARSKNGVQKRLKRVWLYHCFSGRSLASWSDLAEEIVYFERFHNFTDLMYPKIFGGPATWKSPLLKDPKTKTGKDPQKPTKGKRG
jgi:hypothetical protein